MHPPLSRSRSFAAAVLLAALALLPAVAAAQLPDFTALVERVGPGVVNVEATRTAEAALRERQDGQPMPDDEMEEFFRRFFGQPGRPPIPRDRTSSGSGFIISADGYVLTNHHVIDGADEVIVRLVDRREFTAEVVGSDAQSDVALLKIDADGLPALTIGDADSLKPGQWVVAIGSPFGFEHSVTAGIVSAVGRASRMADQQYVPFIQTDVPINRGNSGGPLFDIDGRVVGINSQIFSNTGGYLGISFAIPIEVAMNAVEQLKASGKVTRGLLGVNIQEVTRDMARALGLPKPGGALVMDMPDNSAARDAGIEVGDVILEFDGREVTRSADLPPMVGITPPGTKVDVTVFRDGRERRIPVVIGALEGEAVAAAEEQEEEAANALGLALEELTGEQREELGLDADEGVLVTGVVGAEARRANVQPGDVILMVGRQRVGSVADIRGVLEGVEAGEAVMVLVRRGETNFFTAITAAGD